jgi:hypothetical protein
MLDVIVASMLVLRACTASATIQARHQPQVQLTCHPVLLLVPGAIAANAGVRHILWWGAEGLDGGHVNVKGSKVLGHSTPDHHCRQKLMSPPELCAYCLLAVQLQSEICMV